MAVYESKGVREVVVDGGARDRELRAAGQEPVKPQEKQEKPQGDGKQGDK